MRTITTSVLLSLTLFGCNFYNPIQQLDCIPTGNALDGVGIPNNDGETTIINENTGEVYKLSDEEKGLMSFIINRYTGDYYHYDFFSEKLKLRNGKTKEQGWETDAKSAITRTSWKMQEIVTSQINAYEKGEQEFEVDLKSMIFQMSETRFTEKGGSKISKQTGVCKWKNPKTTTILKQR